MDPSIQIPTTHSHINEAFRSEGGHALVMSLFANVSFGCRTGKPRAP